MAGNKRNQVPWSISLWAPSTCKRSQPIILFTFRNAEYGERDYISSITHDTMNRLLAINDELGNPNTRLCKERSKYSTGIWIIQAHSTVDDASIIGIKTLNILQTMDDIHIPSWFIEQVNHFAAKNSKLSV